jgi:circadian clock protein KaiC
LLVKSGIPGFDEILGGGLPRKRPIILQGGPGSGKTTLATQFLVEGVLKNNEPGIYVTLCESPVEIRENMLSFGWDLEKLEKEGKITIIDARPVSFTAEGYIVPTEKLFKGEHIPFSHISTLIRETINEMGAKRLALDSITVLTSQYDKEAYIRQGMLGFIQVLSSLDCTSILLSEGINQTFTTQLEWVLVPAVILIHYTRKGSAMVRAIQVLKLRGLKHSNEIYHMEISDKGIKIHPEERAELN